MATLSLAIDHAPSSPAVGVDFVSGDTPPAVAARRWLLAYPHIHEVLASPQPLALADLGRHLASQPEVLAVHAVRPRWSESGHRLLEVSATLRQSAYHVELADGSRHFLARDGVLLPRVMAPPPATAPVMRNLSEGGPDALAFADQLWQKLVTYDRGIAEQFPVIDLHWPLQHPLAVPQEFGVAFVRADGALFLMGRADEVAYGHGVADRIADLCHLIRCQGDPSVLSRCTAAIPAATRVVGTSSGRDWQQC